MKGVRAVRGREKETLLSGKGLYGVKVEDAVVDERMRGGVCGSGGCSGERGKICERKWAGLAKGEGLLGRRLVFGKVPLFTSKYLYFDLFSKTSNINIDLMR